MRLIDADALKELRHDYIQGRLKFTGNEYDLIDKCPTIEAEPVVHCKDCKYIKRASVIDGYFICGMLKQTVTGADFCSFGERRC